ncbi:MAG: septum formation inhibitor Maf [Verrucomicrobia bacterium]|nr:septum formation inhibitor Maf [Verrucomicrobiota bacterium]
MKLPLACLLGLLPLALTAAPPTLTAPDGGAFSGYWDAGVAELTSYQLEQNRYGALHPGTAVLIFVTEDFSASKQVKLDQPAQAGKDAVHVLKLNATKDFRTGLYPYTLLTSVFTPIYSTAEPRTLKVTGSVQEWCGHTFTQLNLRNGGYAAQQFSYFESDGDVTSTLGSALLEDEILVRWRIDPTSVPQGKVKLIPSLAIARLVHRPLAVEDAEITLRPAPAEFREDLDAVALEVKQTSGFTRTLTYYVGAQFPYPVYGWDETYAAGFREDGRTLTTKARRLATLRVAYWQKNRPVDRALRKELKLPE